MMSRIPVREIRCIEKSFHIGPRHPTHRVYGMDASISGASTWRRRRATPASSPPSPMRPDGQHGLSPRGQRAEAHRALREILSRYLDCSPDALQFEIQPGGKPYLHAPAHELEFNLSHSRDIALLGIGTSVKLGIDVETYRAVDDPLRIAQRVMSAADCDELSALSGDERGSTAS